MYNGEYNAINKSRDFGVGATFYWIIEPIKGLRYRGQVNTGYGASNTRSASQPYSSSNTNAANTYGLQYYMDESGSISVNNTISYELPKFNGHAIDLMIGQEYTQKLWNNSLNTTHSIGAESANSLLTKGFSYNLPVNYGGNATIKYNGSADAEYAEAAFFGRVNYTLADKYMLTAGDFLDMHQRKIAEDYCKSRKLPVRYIFYGGYADAERCMPVFLPDYIELPAGATGGGTADAASGGTAGTAGDITTGKRGGATMQVPEEIAELLSVVRVTAPKGGRVLTHRDYLGSLLALGLDREVTGDILVRGPDAKTGGGADIIVEASVAEFIEMNYNKAGHTNLTVEILPIGALDTGPTRWLRSGWTTS